MIYILAYFLIGLIPALCYLQGVRVVRINDKRKYKIHLLVAFIVMVSLATFRSENVGADTKEYLTLFHLLADGLSVQDVHSIAVFSTIEYGYLYFTKCVALIFNNKCFFLGINSIITIYSILHYYKSFDNNDEDNSYMSGLIFMALLYTSTLNLMRQYVALAILLYSYDCLKSKRIKTSLCLFLISILIHKSAVIFIPVYIIYRIEDKRRIVIPFIITTITVGVALKFSNIVEYVLSILNYDRLLNGAHMHAADSGGMMAFIYIGIVMIGLCIVLLRKNSVDNLFCQSLILSGIGAMFAWLSSSNEMYSRAAVYFLFNIPVLLTMIIRILFDDKKYYKLMYCAVFFVLIIAMYISSNGYSYSFSIL